MDKYKGVYLTSLETSVVQSGGLSPGAQSGDCIPLEFIEMVRLPLAAGPPEGGDPDLPLPRRARHPFSGMQ